MSALTERWIINRAKLLRGDEVDLEARRYILGAIESALSSLNPRRLIREHLKVKEDKLAIDNFLIDLRKVENIYVVGAGKASAAMAEALYDLLGDRIARGIVAIPKYQKGEFHTGPIELIRAGHPIPTVESTEAALKILQLVEGLADKDLVFCLISGGGSALMASPASGIKLEEKQKITEALLKSGAPINELNTVRKHISNIKGGRLAEKIYPAQTIGLIISDVVGDSLETIASGPTSSDTTTFRDSIETLRRYQLWYTTPDAIRKTLEDGEEGIIPESPKHGEKIFEQVRNFIIGSNELACRSASEYLESNHIEVQILTTFLEGEAKEAGKIISSVAKYMKPKKSEAKGVSIVFGGETTVTVKGNGKGGRNQELVVSACKCIDSVRGLAIASVGTDGIDGSSDAAGGVVDSYSFNRAKSLGLNVESFLDNNDSNTFLEKLDDMILTGHTGTNVNDIAIAVRIWRKDADKFSHGTHEEHAQVIKKIRRVIDLSHTIMAGMPVFPGDPAPDIIQVSDFREKGYRLSKITLGSHTGTHIDAPSHMLENGAAADEIPLDKLMGEAVVLDLMHLDPGKAITCSELQKYDIKEGDIVLLCTGMGKRWGDEKFLTCYPYLSLEGAEWLIEKEVKAVGVDWMSIEKYGESKHPVHDKLLSRNISIIEGLANLDLVKGKRIFFICLPLKLHGLDGVPARAVALERDGDYESEIRL